MVNPTAINSHLTLFSKQKYADKIAVFVGATHGIGEGTLFAMASILETPTFYVVGRSKERFEAKQLPKLRVINGGAKVVFIEAEISLIEGVDKACEEICAVEKRVDYLYMSPGYFPMGGALNTKEGLEVCMVLSYFARMRFLHHLLPLLQKAESPRVLSVLNGGKETRLNEEDLGLQKSWTIIGLVNQSTTMGTLAMHRLSDQEAPDKKTTFIHAYPGFVYTEADRRIAPPSPDSSYLWRFLAPIFRTLFGYVISWRGISAEESGRRHAYHLISERFTPGVWCTDTVCEPWPASGKGHAVVEEYKEKGWPSKVWEFTQGVYEKAVGVKGLSQANS